MYFMRRLICRCSPDGLVDLFSVNTDHRQTAGDGPEIRWSGDDIGEITGQYPGSHLARCQ